MTGTTTSYLNMSDDLFAELPEDDDTPEVAVPEAVPETVPEAVPEVAPVVAVPEAEVVAEVEEPIVETEVTGTADGEAVKEEVEEVDQFASVYAAVKKTSGIQLDTPEELAQYLENNNNKTTAPSEDDVLLATLREHKSLDNASITTMLALKEEIASNPQQAITRLLKAHGIDPLDLDLEDDVPEMVTPEVVNAKELAVTEVLTQLQDSASYNATMQVIGTDWDDASKEFFVDNPNEIRELHSQIESGLFNTISEIQRKERALGNIPDGVSDVDAYITIANAVQQANMDEEAAATPEVKTPVHNPRRASAPPNGVVVPPQQSHVSYLDMSDEDFEKQN